MKERTRVEHTGSVAVRIVMSRLIAKRTHIWPRTMSLICFDGFHSGEASVFALGRAASSELTDTALDIVNLDRCFSSEVEAVSEVMTDKCFSSVRANLLEDE